VRQVAEAADIVRKKPKGLDNLMVYAPDELEKMGFMVPQYVKDLSPNKMPDEKIVLCRFGAVKYKFYLQKYAAEGSDKVGLVFLEAETFEQ